MYKQSIAQIPSTEADIEWEQMEKDWNKYKFNGWGYEGFIFFSFFSFFFLKLIFIFFFLSQL